MSKLYCQVGRLGDVLSVLPLLYADFKKTGQKSQLLVAQEFAKVLDGCSYIEPVIFEGDYRDLDAAVKFANTISDEVIVTSLHGTANAVARHAYSQVKAPGRVTSNFQKEAWNLAGRLHDWDSSLPLVFDARSPEREKRLLDANGFTAKAKKPVLILAVEGGVTAPFPYAGLLRELVTLKFGKQYRIIDLPMTEDGHCYDLLAVMERAALMISIDSMPLHLAWAVRSLPVFALTNDRDSAGKPSLWHGSPWRPNHLWYCRYHDWPARAAEMCEAIHVVSRLPAEWVYVWNTKGGSRPGFTTASLLGIREGMCSRELHGTPFLKDVIRMGLQRADSDDVCVYLSRGGTDINCRPSETPYFKYRVKDGTYSPIADLFSAPKSFWRQILPEIPDLLLDNDEVFWGEALVAIFKKHGAKDATRCCEFVGGEK